ncbi:MAG: S-adenosylmethionine:tRNA ribosyltransferase-isomerase, partial [Gaiellaceae bacterium]
MRVRDLDYELPPELIAQKPLPRRDESRLLVYERATGTVRHRRFRDLPEELRADDIVVLNDTKVLAAKLPLRRHSGGAVEVLLLEQQE